ncbi:MAG: ABC transporter ATP-binding protein [Methanomassiliicoccales archaeon]
MSAEVTLRIDDVVFGYEAGETLKGITIEAKKGQFIGLIGPNGAGKSTLLKCINGALKPKKGTIFMDGKNVASMKQKEIARICANVPADCADDLSLNVHEYIFLGRYPFVEGMWWESRKDEEIVQRAIATFKLEKFAHRKLTELSSGERTRVLLAKALVQEPKVMLVDEPSAHLDLRYQLEIMENLRDLAVSGVTVIAASHDLNLTSRYCDLVIVLGGGKIVAAGKAADIITPELVRDVYHVEAVIHRDGDEIYAIPKRAIR